MEDLQDSNSELAKNINKFKEDAAKQMEILSTEYEKQIEEILSQQKNLDEEFKTKEVAPAKILTKFIKDTKKGEIIGCALDGKLLSKSETEKLASLPSKQELYAKMLGCVNSPATGIVGSINAVMSGLVRAMDAVAKQKSA